jgi:Uma2 family endonuclease
LGEGETAAAWWREGVQMAQAATIPEVVRGKWYPMSWEEFLAWPVEGKTEWVDGWGIAYVSNSTRHGRIVAFFGTLLNLFVRAFDRGEVFLETILLRVPTRPAGRMPDVLVVGRGDLVNVGPQYVDGPALLAIEVLSDESGERDLSEKREEYAGVGVREYLIVDARPDRDDMTFLRLGADGRYQTVAPDAEGRYHSEALPGFWFDPAWWRQEPLPDIEDVLLTIAPEAYEARLLAKIRARRATPETP